jgi:hypothetical protein
VRHAVPAGGREVTVMFNVINERTELSSFSYEKQNVNLNVTIVLFAVCFPDISHILNFNNQVFVVKFCLFLLARGIVNYIVEMLGTHAATATDW